MELYSCSKIVFNSNAAVYDHSSFTLLNEDNDLKPSNLYGAIKFEVEKILKTYFIKNNR